MTVLTCQPADPASKGGVESSVKLAKADIVPKDTNLLPEYASFQAVEAACDAFMDQVSNREHRATRRKPAVMLMEEMPRLHRVPDTAHTVAFGLSRMVPANTPMVTLENGQYLSSVVPARSPRVRPPPRCWRRRAGHRRPRRHRRPGRSRKAPAG